MACTYFHEVNRLYPQKAMGVIDDLVADNRELRDVLIEERNAQYWIQQEDMVVDAAIRGTLLVRRVGSKWHMQWSLCWLCFYCQCTSAMHFEGVYMYLRIC